MRKSKEKKIELLSMTYKVDGKTHIATKETGSELEITKPTLKKGFVFNNSEEDCGPGCKCVDGLVWRWSTFGGVGHWMKTNEPC